jgi:hypothetical protein
LQPIYCKSAIIIIILLSLITQIIIYNINCINQINMLCDILNIYSITIKNTIKNFFYINTIQHNSIIFLNKNFEFNTVLHTLINNNTNIF